LLTQNSRQIIATKGNFRSYSMLFDAFVDVFCLNEDCGKKEQVKQAKKRQP